MTTENRGDTRDTINRCCANPIPDTSARLIVAYKYAQGAQNARPVRAERLPKLLAHSFAYALASVLSLNRD